MKSMRGFYTTRRRSLPGRGGSRGSGVWGSFSECPYVSTGQHEWLEEEVIGTGTPKFMGSRDTYTGHMNLDRRVALHPFKRESS